MGANSGRKVEKQILKKIKARPQPNSGAFPGMPNDGIKGRFLIEVKSTIKKSIRINAKWLNDLEENAINRSKTPALILVLGNKEMALETEIFEWVAIPLRDFQRLSKDWKTDGTNVVRREALLIWGGS